MAERSTIDDFELLGQLGAGSFGVVFKARRLADDGLYVVKKVRISELSFREQGEAINEVKLLAQMNSPYVVRYFDSFIDGESLHIVMEYCNRGDLQNLLKKAKAKDMACLKESVTWNIFLQIVLGLHYLHTKKILHRDLKTANVFLMKDDSQPYFVVKIGDLGVAKLLETSTAFANTIVGTPYYLSPELCADQPYRDKSDCWALGVLLYECCTLRHPFEARNQCALIMKIIQAQFKPPSPTTVSSDMAKMVTWLLQKDPDHRPSIRDILNEESIREKLTENALDVPGSLQSQTRTAYMSFPAERIGEEFSGRARPFTGSGGILGSSGSVEALQDDSSGPSGAGNSAAASGSTVRRGSGSSSANTASATVKKPGSHSRPTRRAPSSTSSGAAGTAVKGNRSRGPVNKQLKSDKALKVHQVRIPNTTTSVASPAQDATVRRVLSDQQYKWDGSDDPHYDVAQEKAAVRALEEMLMKDDLTKGYKFSEDEVDEVERARNRSSASGKMPVSARESTSDWKNECAMAIQDINDSEGDWIDAETIVRGKGGGPLSAIPGQLPSSSSRENGPSDVLDGGRGGAAGGGSAHSSLKGAVSSLKGVSSASPRVSDSRADAKESASALQRLDSKQNVTSSIMSGMDTTMHVKSDEPLPLVSSVEITRNLRNFSAESAQAPPQTDSEESAYLDEEFEEEYEEGIEDYEEEEERLSDMMLHHMDGMRDSSSGNRARGLSGDGNADFEHPSDVATIDLQKNIQDMIDLVEEARSRACSVLGAELFRQIYQLCLKHMDLERNEFIEDVSDPDSGFIRELEASIVERLHESTIEQVLSVVFSVKVLLALENRLSILLELDSERK